MAELSTIVKEYGFKWLINRTLYSAKLKSLNKFKWTEKFYETEVNIKQLDLIDLNITLLEQHYHSLDKNSILKVIKVAEDAIKGKIIAFSSMELDYGYPINWHRHPVSQIEVPNKKKWFEIPDFNELRGDIKLLWEISRFTHLYTFVKAFLVTGEKKYYEAFSYQVDSWVESNIYSYGSNYKCGQEATLRMINILFCYSFFKKIGLTQSKDEENVKIIVRDSYKKVQSNFFYAHKCIRNNHTLSEITGLIIGAWCSEEKDNLSAAYELLDKEILKQFTEDGGYRQFSFNYQRFALQLMEFNFMISRYTGHSISDFSKRLLSKSVSMLYQVQQSNGRVPNYGSNDGALIFPFTQCDYLDYRPLINTLYFQLEGNKLFKDSLVNEELIWFTGANPNEIKTTNKDKVSVSYPLAGIHTLRQNGWFVMAVNNDFNSRPAQMDQNHIDVWYKDFNIFCDTGTYSYASKIGQELASETGHNTVKIDSKEMMNKKGSFFIYNWTERVKLIHLTNQIQSQITSKNGYSHERKIDVKEKSVQIIDKVDSKEDFVLHFHTPYKVELLNNLVKVIINNELSFILITNGKVNILKSYESLYYYSKNEITRIIITPLDFEEDLTTTLEMN